MQTIFNTFFLNTVLQSPRLVYIRSKFVFNAIKNALWDPVVRIWPITIWCQWLLLTANSAISPSVQKAYQHYLSLTDGCTWGCSDRHCPPDRCLDGTPLSHTSLWEGHEDNPDPPWNWTQIVPLCNNPVKINPEIIVMLCIVFAEAHLRYVSSGCSKKYNLRIRHLEVCKHTMLKPKKWC